MTDRNAAPVPLQFDGTADLVGAPKAPTRPAVVELELVRAGHAWALVVPFGPKATQGTGGIAPYLAEGATVTPCKVTGRIVRPLPDQRVPACPKCLAIVESGTQRPARRA